MSNYGSRLNAQVTNINMQPYYSPAKFESDQKDLLIS